MKRIRAVVELRRETLSPEAMDGQVEHFSIPALDATGSPEVTLATNIDSQKLVLVGGEVLISRLNPRKTRVYRVSRYLPRQAVASTEFVALRPLAIDSGYLSYLLQSERTRQDLDGWTRSATRSHQRVEPVEILNLELPVEEQNEQRRIADFLDDRVARIDQIIAARHQQIQSASRWQDSAMDAAMSPYQAKFVPLWLLCSRITDGAHVSPETDSGMFDFVSTRDLSASGQIDFEGALKTSAQSYAMLARQGCQPKQGALLFSKDGTVGRTALVSVDHHFVVASSLVIIDPDPNLVASDYLDIALNTSVVRKQIDGFVRGAGVPRLSLTNLRRVKIPLLPLSEQRAVVQAGSEGRAAFEHATHLFQAQTNLLQEYKQSLITAAVTGEFDVTTASTKIPEF